MNTKLSMAFLLLSVGLQITAPAWAKPKPTPSIQPPSPQSPSVQPSPLPSRSPSRPPAVTAPQPPLVPNSLPVSPSVSPQPTPTPTPIVPQEWLRQQEVRPLPGSLDRVPVFNSNSPEIVSEPGILLSTFPPAGMAHPKAHLNFAFNGRFDIFAHHIGRFQAADQVRSLYLALLVQNPASSKKAVTIRIKDGASYRTQPDAPFIPLPDWLEDPVGAVFAGPGSRVISNILRNLPPTVDSDSITLQPGEYGLLSADPIIVKGGKEALTNGRSLLFQLESTGPIYIASLADFGKPVLNPNPPTPLMDSPSSRPFNPAENKGDNSGVDANNNGSNSNDDNNDNSDTSDTDTGPDTETPPTLSDWVQLLQTGDLVTPRDRTPTPPDAKNQPIIYGRVAGVSLGSEWVGLVTDPGQSTLGIPAPGQAISYPISSLRGGRLGTNQVQSAHLTVRYPDTAYDSNGNYGVTYRLVIPLKNFSDRSQQVAISLETPLKEDRLSKPGLRFFANPPNRIFYRGPVRVRYRDTRQGLVSRYIHLVMRQGQQGEPLVILNLDPGAHQRINVDLVYSADSTPPQVLTIETLPRQTPPPLDIPSEKTP